MALALGQPNGPLSFSFNGATVRVVMRDGEPFWVAKDVCEVLDQPNVSQVLARLEDDEKGVHTVETLGGRQEMAVITEAGLYSLILTSRKPEAKSFKHWVTHEVLPSIRKHGMYATPDLLDDPEHLLRVTMRLVAEHKARLAAEATVLELTPKAEFHDRVAEAVDCQSVKDIAKILGTGQNRMFLWLRGQRILMADNTPYQDYIDAGYFRVIEQTWPGRQGEVHVTPKTLVTGKGLTWLQKRWDRDHKGGDEDARSGLCGSD